MTVQDAIKQYCSYFREQFDKIDTVEPRLYQKILLVALLDTWARAKYPVQGNKERFVNLITDCSDWKDCNRVSLPQLLYLLELSPEASKGNLIKEVTDRFGKWEKGRIYRLDIDPWIDESAPFATTAFEQKLIADSRHADLLYVYRNHLVHEFREPGYGMEISDDDTSPYYHGMTYSGGGQDTWELVYPTGFFKNIAAHSLNNLEQYLQSNNIDPYTLYKFGSIWKRK